MAEQKTYRLRQVAKTFNVGVSTIADFLGSKGFKVEARPNTKISEEEYRLLAKEYKADMELVQEAKEMRIGGSHGNVVIDSQNPSENSSKEDEDDLITVYDRKTDYAADKEETTEAKKEEVKETPKPKVEKTEEKKEEPAPKAKEEVEDDTIRADKKVGLKVLGKIELDSKNRPVKKEKAPAKKETPAPKQEKTPTPKVEENVSPPVETTPKKETPKQETPKQETPKIEKKVEEVKAQPKVEAKKEEPVVKEEPKKEKEITPVEEPKAEVKETPKPEVKKPEVKKEQAKAEVKKEVNPPAKKEPVNNPPVENKEEKIVEKKEEKSTSDKPEDKSAKPKAEEVTASTTTSEENGDEKTIQAKAKKLQGLKIIGKIELPSKSRKNKPVASSDDKEKEKRKRKRKRVKKPKTGTAGGDNANKNQSGNNTSSNNNNTNNQRTGNNTSGNNTSGNSNNRRRGGGTAGGGGKRSKEEVSQKDVDSSYKKTMARMSGNTKSNRSNKSKYRREKRQAKADERDQKLQQAEIEAKILKVTEFISTSELATLMDVSVNEVITTCLSLGMFISINQRLDAEAISVIALEFGYDVDFSSAEEEVDVVLEQEDKEEDLVARAPIVTIMGHVDHGKTSLLDYVRSAKVAEGEAGGITQHIGAYDVMTESGRRVVFLDTPGHEAFTAMRARGAKVTDVAIIVIAADDSVMPQTVEALNHAQVAGVPFVIAINKIDKPGANPDNIRSQLSAMNILVESWGGKVQEQEISAKTGEGIDDLLELVLLESDILTLKANPNKNASGTVVEASLDKGKGYVSTVLIQAGTLKVGDIILSGSYYGRVKAMTDHRGNRLKEAAPATPIQVLGLNGAPQAGDKFNAMESEREAREIATKRSQIMREQSIRATKRTTLSDLGRRIALGNFHQLNIILKGDVDGSIEALSDSLLKLSTDEVEVNIIHKAVGPISESDVYLATSSDAIVIGFQVRPVSMARKLADKEEVEVRLYSVIYDAINDVKDAMEGLLSPDIEEEIVGNVEIREVFRISKVGTVAGCYVKEGYIKRNSKVRLVRDGIVVYGGEAGGEINALKRFKDDVAEVKTGFECGLSIKNYNDIKMGDIVEVFELKETKRTL